MGRKQADPGLALDQAFAEIEFAAGQLRLAGALVRGVNSVRVNAATEKMWTETAKWLRHAAEVLDGRVRAFELRQAIDHEKAMR